MCAAGLTVACLTAQPVARLRTETRVVQIDVEVRDANGRPVEGLTKGDFRVGDSGKSRAIEFFSAQKTSTEPAGEPVTPAEPPASRVFTNRNPARSATHTLRSF